MADPVLSISLSEKMVVFVDDNTNFLHVISWLHLQDEVRYIYWKNVKNTKKSVHQIKRYNSLLVVMESNFTPIPNALHFIDKKSVGILI